MRYKVSHVCIFPSDGTGRIRFTGLGCRSHSQPDASGSPKMDLFLAVRGYYSTVEKKVKKKGKGLFLDSPFSVSKKYADCTAPKPPLCKGWCSAQRMKMIMIAGGNHTITPSGTAKP